MTPAIAKWLLVKVRSDIEAERAELSDARWNQRVAKIDSKQRILWLESHIAELSAAEADLEKAANP